MSRIGIIGAGSWGTALAILLNKNKHKVTVWSWDSAQIDIINHSRHNEAFIHDVRLPDAIKFTDRFDFLAMCEFVILAVPSHAVGEVCGKIKPYLKKNSIIINTAKGFELNTSRRLSEVVKENLPDNPFVVLSGPSHAEEVAANLPTFVTAAGDDADVNESVQKLFSNKFFRVYTSGDLCGVEIGGAVKNVIALASGISEGLGFGDNAKAALIARGLAEITRLGVKMGGKRATFFGLSGVGDLQVTCASMHSRNRRAGIAIGKGIPVKKVQADMGMVVEGINAVFCAYALSQKYDVYMPITAQLYNVLYNGAKPKIAFNNLMKSDPRAEEEDFI